MTRDDRDFKGRRTVITGLGVAAAGMTLAATATQAQTARTAAAGFQPARHDLDAWMNELPGSHRIFIDTATAGGGAEGLLYANNLYNAQVNAYSGRTTDLAMIVCFRHFSTPFGFNDAVWAKYGEGFQQLTQFSDPDTGKAPTVNLMNTPGRPGLPNFGNTVDSLAAKGAMFAICNTATQFMAGQLAQTAGTSSEDVYQELVAGAVGNSHFVPAGVMALTRSQEYGYSVLIAG